MKTTSRIGWIGTCLSMAFAIGIATSQASADNDDMKVYTIDVTSASVTHALSHITFEFDDGAVVQGGEATVTRTHADGSTSQVTYVIVQDDDSSIKFEDADDQLGENGAVHTDTFVITVNGASDSMAVETKNAGLQSVSSLSDPGDSGIDGGGFLITLVSTGDATDPRMEAMFD